ncbi:hypothetical protein F4774DRAFT_393006 [Daldinia eschscholtzii]|nr:hypothetical protein F4774DRAFT_393006 [Daldinia eschscholtzii]
MNQGNGVRQHTTPPSDKTVSRKLKESPGSIECSSSGSSEKRLRIENKEDSDDNKQEEDETRLISRMLPILLAFVLRARNAIIGGKAAEEACDQRK